MDCGVVICVFFVKFFLVMISELGFFFNFWMLIFCNGIVKWFLFNIFLSIVIFIVVDFEWLLWISRIFLICLMFVERNFFVGLFLVLEVDGFCLLFNFWMILLYWGEFKKFFIEIKCVFGVFCFVFFCSLIWVMINVFELFVSWLIVWLVIVWGKFVFCIFFFKIEVFIVFDFIFVL